MTRRHFVLAGALVPGAAVGLVDGSSAGESSAYDEAAIRVRKRLLMAPGSKVPLREFVRYATLAPSSHDIQCLKFRVDGQTVAFRPDPSRHCPAVDPDDHHVFVSFGCATENFVPAALVNRLHGEVVFESPTPTGELP